MKILKNSKIILKDVEVAKSTWQKARGLMFCKKPKPLLMIFEKSSRSGIWMLFMRFPIDLVFLDSEKKVVDIKENIKPISFDIKTWKIYYPKKSAKYVLEMPEGSIKKIKIGMRLKFMG